MSILVSDFHLHISYDTAYPKFVLKHTLQLIYLPIYDINDLPHYSGHLVEILNHCPAKLVVLFLGLNPTRIFIRSYLPTSLF